MEEDKYVDNADVETIGDENDDMTRQSTCQLFRILHLLPAPDVCAVLQVHPASCHASIRSQQQTFAI